MKTTVVLLSLDYLRDKDPRRSLGHASIRAQLAQCPDIDVESLEFAVNATAFRREQVVSSVLGSIADENTYVAIGAYIWNEPVVQWLLPELRRAGFRGRIVLGGPQISYAPAGLDRTYPDADAFVRGYGEVALQRLLCGEHEIPGVTWRGSDDGESRADVDLCSLTSPYLAGVLGTSDFVRWETQRGCPYSCAFCQHMESGAKLRLRKFAPARIQAEIELLVARGVKDIAVLDPVFNDDPEHAVSVLQPFATAGYRGRLSLQCRFESVTPEFLDVCQSLNAHLEFGLQTVQPAEMKAIRRTNNLSKVDAAIAELHRRRIDFEVSLIYGLPEQTVQSFHDSVNWSLARKVPLVRAFPLMLLRGTPLERDRARWGLIENDEPVPLVVQSNTFSRADWEAMRDIAARLELSRTRVGEHWSVDVS